MSPQNKGRGGPSSRNEKKRPQGDEGAQGEADKNFEGDISTMSK